MEQLYALKLWDPATPAFYSALKLYIGGRNEILRVAAAMEESDKESETTRAIREYFAGNVRAMHSVAYREVPVLEPVEVLARSAMELHGRTWKHPNTWGFEYEMRSISARIEQVVVQYEGMYQRFLKAAVSGLCYKVLYDSWRPVGSLFMGNAGVLDTELLADGQRMVGNILYVPEDTSEVLEPLLQRINDTEKVRLDSFCDEIFGDG